MCTKFKIIVYTQRSKNIFKWTNADCDCTRFKSKHVNLDDNIIITLLLLVDLLIDQYVDFLIDSTR